MQCLDCGGEVRGGQCEVCGRTPLAAEVALRRRLLTGTAVFLLGALGFLAVIHFFPPLEIDAMLIFVGVLFFAMMALWIVLDLRARQQRSSQILKRMFYGLVPLPALFAALLFTNARFDLSPPEVRTVEVIGRFAMPGTLKSSRIVVRSWREGRRVERIAVSRDEYTRYHEGDVVEVRVQEGLAGIPWVSAVYRK